MNPARTWVVLTVFALALTACVSRTGATARVIPTTSTAADGTDVTACADGDCEIEVPGPVVVPIPNGTLELLEWTEYGIEYDFNQPHHGGVGTLVPGCPVTFYLDPPGVKPSRCQLGEDREAPTPEPGELVVHLVLERNGPVLRMAMG